MNKLNFVFLAALVMVLVLSSVSAYAIITGTVYDVSHNGVANASVLVNCTSEEIPTMAREDGSFHVAYPLQSGCGYGSNVTVYAYKEGIGFGMNNEIVKGSINLGMVGDMEVILGIEDIDVPLIPEFGFIAGTIAIAGAVGLFFFVRRK
jgi:hypothetical protein